MTVKCSDTKYGFIFGSMEVSRTCLDKTATIICVKTPKAKFSIRATKTGNMKIYDEQGNECEIVSKDYMDQLNNK